MYYSSFVTNGEVTKNEPRHMQCLYKYEIRDRHVSSLASFVGLYFFLFLDMKEVVASKKSQFTTTSVKCNK